MKFVEARWHGQGGNDKPTRVVIHDAEYPEKITGAEDVAAYFQRVERKESAHYVADCDSVVQCVLEQDVAYHAPPNAHSIGIELCGYAKQTTDDWLDAYGVAMLRDQAAPLVRDICDTYGIPKVWLSVQDLLDGKHGITSHNNVSLAWHQSTHTDPGGNFPIDQFMQWVLDTPPPQEDEDMPIIVTNEDNNFRFLIQGGLRFRLDGPQDDAGHPRATAYAEASNPHGAVRAEDRGNVSTGWLVEFTKPGNDWS